MKKILVMLMMLFMMTGCGESEIKDLDISKASNAVEQTLAGMETIESETLDDVYDIDLELLEEYVIKQNNDGEMYAIILTNNKSDVKEDMEDYFDKVRDFNTAYSPETVKLIDERLEKEIGNYLIYIVSNDSEKVYQDIINTME